MEKKLRRKSSFRLNPVIEALQELLHNRIAETQEDICHELEKKGFDVNQTKVSRLLRKVGAVKVKNERGIVVYSLPNEPGPPTLRTPLRDLIIDITRNEALVVIYTHPGIASMVARLLDYNKTTSQILGTIAGDDVVFVAPKSLSKIQEMEREIKDLFEM